MTIESWLRQSIEKLRVNDIPTPELDAEVLIADALKKNRAWVKAHPEEILETKLAQELDRKIQARINHTPLAYIRGRQEFYGREFSVSPDTLTPRPETETMIDLLKKHYSVEDTSEFIDIGTGSGCIAITANLELGALTLAIDISEPALVIAQDNSTVLNSDVTFNIFDITNQDASTLQTKDMAHYLCNLPYVPDDFSINLAASHEPKFAIYGGTDGLDHYRKLFSDLSSSKCLVYTESLPTQHEAMKKIANEFSFQQIDSEDFIQVFSKTAE